MIYILIFGIAMFASMSHAIYEARKRRIKEEEDHNPEEERLNMSTAAYKAWREERKRTWR